MPLFPEMSHEQVQYAADTLTEIVNGRTSKKPASVL